MPLIPAASSSPVINRLIEPAKPAPRSPSQRWTAATKAAIAPFMSTAPRPHSAPSRRLAENGSNDQASRAPGGTTSVCPAKHRLGRPPAEAGIEVDDLVAAILAAKGEAMAAKAERFEISGDDVERALVPGGDARPADQLGGERRRVDGGVAHSRSNSLIAVLARVWASTVLTITAQ